jgi:hypothetical protein
MVTIALVLSFGAVAGAQGRSDVVTLANGDRITGEVVRLDRGRLEFKTDDAGTLNLEWDKLTSVVAARLVEVTTIDGRTFLGTLIPSVSRSIAVRDNDRTVTLPMSEVTLVTTIGRSFLRKLDGSIDAGFSYTKSSGVAQLNLNTDTVYRKPRSHTRLTMSFTQTERDDGTGDDDRGAIEGSYLQYPWPRWFVTGVGRFESNKSLGLILRSQIGGAIGPRLVNSNRAQLTIGAGLAFNDEQGVDVGSTQNLEALLLFQSSYYTYDRPKTNVDVSVQYYPSLSNAGRQRLQLDAAAKREFWKDLFLSINAYDTFDSRPPNPDADRNDVGVVVSIGWSY